MDLNSPVSVIKGIGEKTAKTLNKIGVYTVRDILLRFPYSFLEYPKVTDIAASEDDVLAAIKGKVCAVPYKKGGKNDQVITRITDGTGNLSVLFFHMPYVKNNLHVGDTYVFYGKISRKNSNRALIQPKIFSEEEYNSVRKAPVPVYHLTQGLSNNAFTKYVKEALSFACLLDDYLPDSVITENKLSTKEDAIKTMHFPSDFNELIKARERIVFEEFFLFLLKIELNKESVLHNGIVFTHKNDVLKIADTLPFTLTNGQSNALNDILTDLECDIPMQRLLQGDVGSGKTIVAFLSMLDCAFSGHQSILMAPTEVLATQHYEKLCDFINAQKLDFNVYLLTGSITPKEKVRIKEAIQNDATALVIGTHALLEEDVVLPKLGLVITDEQHRFGVKQRETMFLKGVNPHVLVMSATPIPRTLSIILYGDLKVSLITELPSNRIPIKNCVVNKSFRNKSYEFIENEVKAGHQAYIICPLVSESDGLDLCDTESYFKMMTDYYGDRVKVGILNGKMRNKDKTRIMENFKNKKIDVLISTTVVEVGVDVPNATVMMIENAERFGLSQLHQLRGRIGRGESQSYCIFMQGNNGEINKRLKILNESNDGFYIANMDLKLRGPGDIFGIRQSGELDFVVADIYNDAEILKTASNEVSKIKDAATISKYRELLQQQSLNL